MTITWASLLIWLAGSGTALLAIGFIAGELAAHHNHHDHRRH